MKWYTEFSTWSSAQITKAAYPIEFGVKRQILLFDFNSHVLLSYREWNKNVQMRLIFLWYAAIKSVWLCLQILMGSIRLPFSSHDHIDKRNKWHNVNSILSYLDQYLTNDIKMNKVSFSYAEFIILYYFITFLHFFFVSMFWCFILERNLLLFPNAYIYVLNHQIYWNSRIVRIVLFEIWSIDLNAY